MTFRAAFEAYLDGTPRCPAGHVITWNFVATAEETFIATGTCTCSGLRMYECAAPQRLPTQRERIPTDVLAAIYALLDQHGVT